MLIEDRASGTDLGKKFVLTLKADNSIEYRLVDLGPEIDGLRVVRQGLQPGDVIVVNGLQHVKPGQTVAPTRVAMNQDNVNCARWRGTPLPLPGTSLVTGSLPPWPVRSLKHKHAARRTFNRCRFLLREEGRMREPPVGGTAAGRRPHSNPLPMGEGLQRGSRIQGFKP